MVRFAGVRRVVGFIGFAAAVVACEDESQLADGPSERVGEASAAICRSVELTATKTYNPDDQIIHYQLLDPPATFALPQNLSVIQGGANPGDEAVFGFSGDPPEVIKCFYVATSSTNYALDYCRYESGPLVTVTQVTDAVFLALAVHDGDSALGPTVISTTLQELAPCDGVDCGQSFDDNNPCTVDSCDPVEGIKHTPIEVDDGNPLTIEVCLPATGVETWTAPALPGGTATVVDAWSFLYTDPDPLQSGVGQDAIDAVRAAVIHGYVFEPDGDPKPLASISILGRPELGTTITDGSGRYLMVVNGGGPLTVDIQVEGYLPAQRRAEPRWQGSTRVDDVVLVDPGLPDGSAELDDGFVQVITDTSTEEDGRGERQLKVLVQPETTASVELPDGSLVPFDELDPAQDTLTLTIKEYTVGEDGPRRMPAALPPSSAYTYAVEIRAEEAEAVGATGVVFDKPIHVYLDNFLGFPVGTVVPVGRYDHQRGIWIPEQDGLVISIVGISGGEALIDLDGIAETPIHESPAELNAVGLNQQTRLTLAEEYPTASASTPVPLWHVRLKHLSPCDFNWPLTSPGACSPEECGEPPQPPQDDPDDCEAKGSRIECSNQILGERFAIAGTPYSLAYSSDRVPGRARPQRRMSLPLTGGAPSPELRFVEAQIDVAGRTFSTTLTCPETGCEANEDWAFNEWDGRDLLGRTVQGSQPAVFTITYGFDAEYANPTLPTAVSAGILITPEYAFARWADAFATTEVAGPAVRLTTKFEVPLGTFDARSDGLGGFTFDDVHHYSIHSRTLLRGDGTRRRTGSNRGSPVARKVDNIVPLHGTVRDLEAEDDGSLLVLTAFGGVLDRRHLYRYDREGTATTLAGNPDDCGLTGDCLLGVDNMARGADGTIYLAAQSANLVYRLSPAGTIETFAGNGTIFESGDGDTATDAGVPAPSAVAVDASGAVYIAQGQPSKIRRVDANGRIATVVTATPEPGAVTVPGLGMVHDMHVGTNGALYVLGLDRIWRIGADGTVVVAGGGGQSQDDGIVATAANLENPPNFSHRFVLGPDATLDLSLQRPAGAGVHSIRRITPGGHIYTLVGRLSSPTQVVSGLGGPAANAVFADDLGNLRALARTPDGRIFSSLHRPLPSANPHGLIVIEPELPGVTDLLSLEVASEDGREVYVFDHRGRHLQTVDSRFGNVILSIERDAEGRIMTLTDENNRVTTVTRDGTGDPTAIIGPDAHVTNLIVNGDGYLVTAEDPRGDAYQVTYEPGGGGLMKTWTNRNGKITEFTWDQDGDGRLTAHENDAGGIMTLEEIASASGTKVERTTPLLRKTTYERVEDTAGVVQRTSTSPSLLQATSTRTPGGETVTQLPDGTKITTQLGGDPRFAMQAPLVTYQKVRLPSGKERVVVRSRAVTLGNPNDWTSLLTSTETTTVCNPPLPTPPSTACAGRTWTRHYDAVSRTEVVTSPENRTRTTTYDAAGRATELAIPGDHPLYLGYDLGRLKTTQHGPLASGRLTTREYDDGFLFQIIDPVMVTEFGRNVRGDVTSVTRAGGIMTGFGVGGEQQTTSVTPPGELPHYMTYDEFDKLESYQPPLLDGLTPTPTTYDYDLDKNIKHIDPPELGTIDRIDFGYDTAGRLKTTTFPGGFLDRTYNPLTGRLHSVSGPYGMVLVHTYDGRLPTSVSWEGDFKAVVDFYHYDDFRLSDEKVEGGWRATFVYDDDSLLTSVETDSGTLTLGRDLLNGRVTSATSGNVVETFDYVPTGDTLSFGELAGTSATYSGSPQLSFSYDLRDGIGRILQKTETLLGATTIFSYQYDDQGRIEYVRDATTGVPVVLEHYGYDDNGNRILSTNSAGTNIVATFDEQDRIETYGDLSFQWTLNGELETKTNSATTHETSYTYDALGNLVSVALPKGDEVDYLVDGAGRRVGRKFNGNLEKIWLWRSQLQLVAELDANEEVVARFIYTEGVNAPELMLTSEGTFRLIKDHLGSVRLVINDATGEIRQQLVYDSWGRVLHDSKPGFQPFGFAGGLYDPDTELVRFGARDYDPEIGRWLSKDPIRFSDSGNLYQYATSDPVNYSDPSGEYAAAIVVAGVAGTAALVTAGVLVTAALVDEDVQWLPPIPDLPSGSGGGLEPLPDASATFGALAAAAGTAVCATAEECERQWDAAYARCERLLRKKSSSRRLTGGYTNIHDCARGFVSEACGGNPIDWGPEGPP